MNFMMTTMATQTRAKKLIKMIDVIGRQHEVHKKGMLLFYVYENGLVEKKVIH